jgi:hypothetical protein
MALAMALAMVAALEQVEAAMLHFEAEAEAEVKMVETALRWCR